jgi:hypothetical protein
MRVRGRWASKAVAIAAAGVTIMAGAACGDSSDAADKPASGAQATTPPAASPGPLDLHTLVIPAGEGHPAKGKVLEADFHKAAESGLLTPPKGMTFTPDQCVNFIDMGDPSKLNGWLQYNEAAPVGKEHNLAHKDFFVGTVFQLPNGVDVAKIRQTALTCSAGSVSLAGKDGSKITGELVNTEVDAQQLTGADTFEMTQRLQFGPAKDARTKAILEQYYGELDADGGVLRLKQIVIVGMGNVLYLVNMQDRDAARKLAADFHRRAVEAGL